LKKPKAVMDTTDNSSVYNKSRKYYLSNTGRINCTYCRYHRGENSSRKQIRKKVRYRYNKIKYWEELGCQEVRD
jgi:2-iminoacetate synthase ThiH